MTFGKGIGADEHHCPNGAIIQEWTDPNRMAENDVLLQFFDIFNRDQLVFECAKTSGDAIGDVPFTDELLDRIRRTIYGGNGIW